MVGMGKECFGTRREERLGEGAVCKGHVTPIWGCFLHTQRLREARSPRRDKFSQWGERMRQEEALGKNEILRR